MEKLEIRNKTMSFLTIACNHRRNRNLETFSLGSCNNKKLHHRDSLLKP